MPILITGIRIEIEINNSRGPPSKKKKIEPNKFHQDNVILKPRTRCDIIDLLQLGLRIMFNHAWLDSHYSPIYNN